MRYFSVIVLIVLFSCSKEQKTKSITKKINDTILEKKDFDSNNNLVFEKHNQIDFRMKNSLIFITAFEYDSINNINTKYYAHSNSGLKVTIDSFDLNMSLRKNKIKVFNDIEKKESYRNKLLSINSKKDFLKFFNSIFPSKKSFDYNYKYSDTIKTTVLKTLKGDTLIVESKKIQDNFTLEYSKTYFNKKEKKIKEIRQNEYNELIEYIYDGKERVIYENMKGQFYKYYYKNNLLDKKELYHGNNLAFKVEYFYKKNKVYKEIKYRITESKYFQEIPKKNTIMYDYQYY